MFSFLTFKSASVGNSIESQHRDMDSSRDNAVFDTAAPLLPDSKEEDEYQNEAEPVWKPTFILNNESKKVLTASVLTSVSTVVVMISLWLLWGQIQQSLQHKPFIYDLAFTRDGAGVVSCGESVPEAIALGCTFDELADLWLPPKCSRTYADQYAHSNDGGPFLYYADKEGRYEISNRSLYVGEEIYWSTTRDHLVHCAFNMFRFAHSLRYGSIVGHDGTFSGHVEHCATLLSQYALQAPGIDNIDVETQSGFGYC